MKRGILMTTYQATHVTARTAPKKKLLARYRRLLVILSAARHHLVIAADRARDSLFCSGGRAECQDVSVCYHKRRGMPVDHCAAIQGGGNGCSPVCR